MDINPALVDIGNPSTLPGSELGGCDPRTDQLGDNHPLFASSFATIPRSDWAEQSKEDSCEALVDEIKNQKHEGSCASFATVQAKQIVDARTFGIGNVIHYSPQSLFKLCSRTHRGGSTISCNFSYLKTRGLLPEDTEKNRKWMREVGLNDQHVLNPVGFSQSFPQDWEQTAHHFRGSETYDIDSFDEMATALLLGFPVVYGRSGHAINGVRLVRYKNQWAIKYSNSWGNWGDEGYGYDTERYISSSLARYGAIALRSVYVHNL